MLIKILGGLDIIFGFILLTKLTQFIPTQILFIIGIILLAKSTIGFLKDFASWIDLLTGIVFILSGIFSIPYFIQIIFGILIIQKGAISFL